MDTSFSGRSDGRRTLLHFGGLAGWPFKMAGGLRRRGVDAVNAVGPEKDVLDLDRKLPYDLPIYSPRDPRLVKYARKIRFLFDARARCSLVHYHHATIIDMLPHHVFEGPVLASAGIPMVMTFSGTDARIISQARKNNPFFYLDPDEAYDERITAWLRSISRNIRYAATDCEMREYVEPYFDKVFLLRQPVDFTEISCEVPSPSNDCPVVLHIPTNPQIKGTPYVEAAVERLRAEGLRFEFRLVRQLTQKQLYEEITKCDIYVDELRCGAHGMTPVETMAAGKPTITYIRDDLRERYPHDLPLVNANPDTIYQVLRDLIADPAERQAIGRRSRAYVEKYHGLDTIVSDLIGMYREIGVAGLPDHAGMAAPA